VTVRIPLRALALAILVVAPAAAAERYVKITGSSLERRTLDASCATPGSKPCVDALADAVPQAASRLVRLAERRHPRAAELAQRAADSAYPELRSAAAEALGQLSVQASFTPVLTELLDDPVPAVRAAALKALYGSMDERGRSYAERAEVFGSWSGNASLSADGAPATANLGVQIPADAVFLRFGSSAAVGRYAFVTAEAPAALAARLKKAGSGPYRPDQWYDMLLSLRKPSDDDEAESDDDSDSDDDSGMPSAADMAKAMEMMGKMNQALNEHPDAKTPEQQGRLISKALEGVRHVDLNLGDYYGKESLFGAPQLFLLELKDGSDVAVAVYHDKLLNRTGIAVHRTP
jgi:hypothetical protein